MGTFYVSRNGVTVNAKTGEPKKQKPVPYGRERFSVSSKPHNRNHAFGRDVWFEVALEIVRWFWYEEKILITLGVVINSVDVRAMMESIYRVHVDKTVSERNWPSVLELVYKPKIDRFFEMHRNRLSELNLVT